MPQYEYRCDGCKTPYTIVDSMEGDTKAEFDRGLMAHIMPDGSVCGMFKRDFSSVHIAPVMQEHMNATVGKPISDMGQFKRELREAGEKLEERTGVPHDFQPVDLRDKDSLGVDDTGLDATHDAMVKAGIKEPTGTTVFRMGD